MGTVSEIPVPPGGGAGSKPRPIRPPTVADALIPVVSLAVLIGLATVLFAPDPTNGPLQVALLPVHEHQLADPAERRGVGRPVLLPQVVHGPFEQRAEPLQVALLPGGDHELIQPVERHGITRPLGLP